MNTEKKEITLKSLMKIFLPMWWLILVISLVCAAAFGGYSLLKDDTYTSTGKYMISKTNFNGENIQTGLNPTEVEAMHVMIANLNEMIKTNNFAEEVIEKLKTDYNITNYNNADIKSMMTVKAVSDNTTCYNFSVISSNPEHSHAIAFVAGELLVENFAEETVYAVKISLIEDPAVAKAPNSKNVVRNAIIGFAGGLLISLVLVFVRSRFDVVIRNRDKIEDNFDLPILGVIPRVEIDS